MSKARYIKSISLSEQDKQSLDAILERGVTVIDVFRAGISKYHSDQASVSGTQSGTTGGAS